MSETLILRLDEYTTVEKNNGVFTIRQVDYSKENEKSVFLTVNDLEEIVKLTNLYS